MARSIVRSKIVGTGTFRVYRHAVVYWRAIILLLILAPATFLIAHDDFFDLLLFALLLIFIASQLFWIGRILDVGERLMPGKPRRAWLAIMAGLIYFVCRPVQLSRVGSWSHNLCRQLPATEHVYLRRILVVVRGIAAGLSASDGFRGGRPGSPRRWVGLPQRARGYTPALRRC